MYTEKLAKQIAGTHPETGFHVFTTKDGKSSYFYFAATDGLILLISRPYSRARSAERAYHNLIEKSPSFEWQNTDKLFQFQLLNGNQKPVAQSRPFEQKEEATAAIDSIKGFLGKTTDTSPKVAPKEEPKEEETIAVASIGSPSFRHSFRLDFYPDEDQPSYRGKIEHLLSRKTQTFQGLDIHSIEAFVKRFLEGRPKVVKSTAASEENPIQLELWQADQPTGNFNFPLGSVLEVALSLRKKVKEAVEAELFLKPMEKEGEIRQLVGKQVLETGRNKQRIALPTQTMEAGFYQLIARINEPAGDGIPLPIRYEGRQIIHLY